MDRMEEKFSWKMLVKWLKTYIIAFMGNWSRGKVFAKAVVQVLTNLGGDELSQVRDRLAPTSEECLTEALTDHKSVLLRLLEDPQVAAAIARLTSSRPTSRERTPPKRKTWAEEAREGIQRWMGKVEKEERDRLELILRIAEETGCWPSRDLVTSMLEWRVFSEGEVRRWLSRLDADGRIPSDGIRQESPPAQRTHQQPKVASGSAQPPNNVGNNIGADKAAEIAGMVNLDTTRFKGLGPAKLEALKRAGITTVGQLARATEEDVKLQIGAIGRKAFEVFVAAAKELITEAQAPANGT